MSGEATNNDGSGSVGKHKYPDEHGYVAVIGKDLYNPENFSGVSFDTLRRYQQRHNVLNKDKFMAGCYATMTPKGELIKIMKRVGEEMLMLTNQFTGA